MEFRKHTLDNGLQLIAECNPGAYSAAFGFFVNTGSRDETEEVSGVSHFLEHMVFKGTPKRTAADVNRELDEMGSQSNAFTSEEQTVYYARVLPELQGRTIELLSDLMRPSLRDDDFEVEKQVILEEIAKYEDAPPYGAHEKCMAEHFGDHPLAGNVLGTVESVGNLTLAQMQAFFQQQYSPANMTLAAAGNVDFPAMVREAEELCGGWQAFDVRRETPPPGDQTRFRVIPKPSSAQEYVVQISNSPPVEDERRYAANLLAMIVGDDSGSRMFWDLVDTGQAEHAAIGNYEFQGAGIMMTFLACRPESTASNLQRVRKIQQEVQRSGVSEEELHRAKSKICSHLVLQNERPTSRLFSVGLRWVQRQDYLTVREVVDAFQRVTREDIAQLLSDYPLTNTTTVAIGPLTDLS